MAKSKQQLIDEISAQRDELSIKFKSLIAQHNALRTKYEEQRATCDALRANSPEGRTAYKALLEELKLAPKGSKIVGHQLVIPQ